MDTPDLRPFVVKALPTLTSISPKLAGIPAFWLFCATPPRAKVRPDEQAVHDQATQERFTWSSIPLAVYRWGSSADRVLLVHGRDGRSSNFARLVPMLVEAGFEVIAFDAPGHGESGGQAVPVNRLAEATVAVAREYGPFRGAAGHSFGALALMNSLRRGNEIPRVVTVSSICHFDSLPTRFLQQLRLPASLEGELRWRSERLLAPDTDIWQTLSAGYDAENIDTRLLVVHDRQDREIESSEGEALAAAFGDRATLELTDGLGHRRILRDETVMKTAAHFLAE